MSRVSWRRIGLAGGIGFGLLLLAAIIIFQSGWFRERLRGIAMRQAAAAINADIQIEGLSGSLLRDVTLRGVRISQDGRPLLSAATIELRYDALQLIAGRWSLDRIAIHRPVINLAQDQHGWNISRLVRVRAEAGPSAPWSIALRGIVIDDADISVSPLTGPSLHFTSVAIRGDATIGRDSVVVTVESGSLRDQRSGEVVTALAGRLRAGDGAVRLEQVAAETATMTVRGSLLLPSQPLGKTEMAVAADLRDWTTGFMSPYLSRAPDLPPLTGSVTAQGAVDALQIRWALSSAAGKTTGSVQGGISNGGAFARGTVTMDQLNPGAFLPGDGLDGELTGEVDLDATLTLADARTSRSSFVVRRLRGHWLGYRADALEGHGEWRHDTLQFAGRGRAYGAAATFNVMAAGVSEPSRRVTIDGAARDVNVAQLPAQLGAPSMPSRISGRYRVTVAADSWRADFVASDSSIAGATIHKGTVVCASAAGRALTLQVDGSISNASATLLRLPAERSTSLSGDIRADVRFADRLAMTDIASMDGTLAASLRDSSLMGIEFSHAAIDVSVSRGLVDVRQFEAQAPSLAAVARGRLALNLDDDIASDLAFSVEAADLSILGAFGAPALRGGAHVEGTVAGPAQRLHVEAQYEGRQVGYGDVADALTLEGKISGDLPDRDPAKAVMNGSLTSAFVRVRQTELRRVAITAKYSERVLDLHGQLDQPQRSLEFDGGIAFRPELQEVRFRTLTLGGEGEPWKLAPGAQPVIRYGRDRVELEQVVLTRGSERIDADGVIVLGADAGSDLSVTLADIRVGDAYKLLAGEPRVTGTASAKLRLSGRLDNPTVAATLTIAEGTAASVAFTRVEGTVALADRRATVEGYIDEANGNRLLVRGAVPTRGDAGPIDLNVSSEQVSLALVQAFTSEVQDVQGVVAIDAHLAGPLTAPVINGRAALTDGALRVMSTGVRYVRMEGEVAFDGTDLHVTRFSLEDDDGHRMTMTGTGTVLASDGHRSVDMDVHTEDIHLLRNRLGDVEVSASLHAEGDLHAPRLTGDVRFNRGRIEVDEVLREFGVTPAAVSEESLTGPGIAGVPPTVAAGVPAGQPSATPGQPSSDAHPAPASPPDPDSLYGRTAIDVRLVLPDNVVLRGKNIKTSSGGMGIGDMNLTVGGAMTLRKQRGGELEAVGAVEVVRGFYQFQGRRFNVERGSTVDFRTGDLSEPRINVTGTRDVAGVTARVHVTGTAQRPVVTLSSQPPLEEGDVMSLIVFNQPMNELGASEQTDLMQRAGDMALSAVAGSVADSIGRAFNVDLLEIRVPSADRTGEVAVGNQVSERLFVGFRQQFGEASSSRLSFEYRLSEAIRLLTTFGQGSADRQSDAHLGGTAGLDLFYTLRY